MEIQYASLFRKAYAKANVNIREAFKRRRILFEQDPFHPLLHNHALTGKYTGLRSINITGDWRALYEIDGQVIKFKLFGTHSQLYR